MSFCSEDVPLDYQLFIGAATYLLKRIEADPASGFSEFESILVQKGHPSYREVRKHAEWMLKMTQRCCFSVTSFLGALIYIERLRRQHKLSLYESTWRSTWVAMSVISEKRWEDNYIHPGHVHNMYGSKHTTLEQQQIQLKLFKALDFNLGIELDEFSGWINKLRADDKDQHVLAACKFQRVFIPRPIPNLKTKKTQSTPSTSANSESESESQSEQRYPKQSTSQKYDVQNGNHHFTSRAGYTVTPRVHGEGPTAMTQYGAAATCRRDYHSQLSNSQLHCDWAPQPVPDLRPGACGRDFPPSRTGDYWIEHHRMAELRMQELKQQRNANFLRTSWLNAEHQQQSRHQQWTTRTPAMPSWTTRAPQYDMHYPRSGVIAWS